MKTLLSSKQTVKNDSFSFRVARRRRRRIRHLVSALKVALLLALLGGVCALFIWHPGASSALSPFPQAATTCPQLLSTADYPQIVHVQPPSQQMTAVQLVDGLTGNIPAALIQVANQDAQNSLDVYVFGCTLSSHQPRLTRLFTQQGLVQGAVMLTPDHRLILKTLDTRLVSGSVAFLQPLQQNIYHEYVWRQGSFVQVPFAGFYPVTSRVEAQALQQNANEGANLTWSDPLKTAQQMSKDLLHWSPAPQAQLLSQTGDTAVVELTHQDPHVVLQVTLKQLIQPNNSTGLWFVTDARTRGMLLTQSGTLNQPLASSQSSPIHFSGGNALLDGQTSATLFDHTLTPVSQATNVPLAVHTDSSYNGTLTYAHLEGGQEGVLLVESLPTTANFNKETGQVILMPVLLN